MTVEQMARRYRDLGEALRFHGDKITEAQTERGRIVLDCYDKLHLTPAEIAEALGDGLTATQVRGWLMSITGSDG